MVSLHYNDYKLMCDGLDNVLQISIEYTQDLTRVSLVKKLYNGRCYLMNIAIVGFGISGASILKTLTESDKMNQIEAIHLFEKSQNLATGYPYQEDHLSLLMNSYSSRLSLNPDNSDEYLQWLEDNYPQYAKDKFSPRQIFGKYLQARYLPALNHDKVTFHQEEVIDIDLQPRSKENGGLFNLPFTFTLTTNQGVLSQSFDVIFLALGHPPYADHYDLSDAPGYINNPFPISKITDYIPQHKSVGIIGSGLTGIDIMYYLHKIKHLQKPITFYIRHEPFTNVKNELYQGPLTLNFDHKWIENHRQGYQGSIPLKVIWQQIVEDMEANQVNIFDAIQKYQHGSLPEIHQQLKEVPLELQKIQRYVGLLTEFLPDLFMALSPADRQLFNEEYLKLFEHFRTQLPEVKLKQIIQWMDEGSVKIVSRLTDIHYQDDKFILENKEGLRFEEDILVNATGFQMNLSKAGETHPLIKHLYDKEIITQNPLGGITVTWPIAHPISSRYGQLTQMIISGFWIFKTQFGNNNAQMTAKYGQTLAQHILNTYL